MNKDKEAEAIKRLKAFENEEGYVFSYSGGKDSDVIRILAELSGVKHIIVNKHTTVDAPETVRYIRSIPNINIIYPKKTMWQLIVEKRMPPTQLARYCCKELKETTTDIEKGKIVVTGVRWEESRNRQENQALVSFGTKNNKRVNEIAQETNANLETTKKGWQVLNDDNDSSRRMVEQCFRTRKTMVNPIIDWSEQDVWEFLHHYGCESNPLYQCGFKRIGCIGCPIAAKKRYEEFRRYPKYKDNYIRAFQRMQDKRIEDGIGAFGNEITPNMSGKDIFKWWMNENVNQLTMFDEEGEIE